MPSRFCEPSIFCDVLALRDKNFPVLLKPLFVNGDFNGISSEPVEGIDENDLPFLRGIAVREHPLKLRPVVVGAGHGTVYIRSHNAQPVTLRKFVADAELSFYGIARTAARCYISRRSRLISSAAPPYIAKFFQPLYGRKVFLKITEKLPFQPYGLFVGQSESEIVGKLYSDTCPAW